MTDQQDGHRYKTIDGGRGIGILGVAAGHFFWYIAHNREVVMQYTGPMRFVWWTLEGTWIGIDFFFVVSGLMITRILLDSRNDPAGLFFKNFYGRRVLRIFPLYYGTLALLFLVLPHFVSFHTRGLERMQAHQVYLWCYLQNMVNVGWNAGLLHLGHFWSLAVEEQFYLTWPILVFCFSRKGLIRITTAMILICPFIRWYGIGHLRVYENTFCRMDALAYGCLLALALDDPALKARLLKAARPLLFLSLAGLGAVFAMAGPEWFRMPHYDPFGLAALDLASAAYALLVLAGRLPLHARVLETRWLRFMGKNTYGIYVLHNIFIGPMDRLLLPPAWFYQYTRNWYLSALGHLLAEMLVSVAVAVAVREFYEKQFLRLYRFFPRKPIVLGLSDSADPSVAPPLTLPEVAELGSPPPEAAELGSPPAVS